MIVANEATLENLVNFESIAQLNETVREHKRNNKLNKTEVAVLDILHRHSAKYIGVSFLRKNKIGELIGKSRRTIIRVSNRLESLNIIKQHEMKRASDMQQTSNAIVILPFIAKDTPSTDAEMHDITQEVSENVTHKTTPSLKQPNNNTYKDTTIASNALKGALPNNIYDAMSRYFSAEAIYKYYGILLRAKSSVDSSVTIEDNPAPFVDAWHATILKAKQGKVRKMDDYLYASWRQATYTAKALQNDGGSMARIFAECMNG
ncbi:helix-turn-helix domain-containing protein [Bacillus sp. 03113]|uniref:helix-turn-helix domain-containing protein n=1 Tax=Bacillus sp. 03113 TaxID=2578211 RepID=UPI0011450FE3|nr:helix-turn-helix domain-containing protein [Bacillus sp. 03113]